VYPIGLEMLVENALKYLGINDSLVSTSLTVI
jgi:hypothetical protein